MEHPGSPNVIAEGAVFESAAIVCMKQQHEGETDVGRGLSCLRVIEPIGHPYKDAQRERAQENAIPEDVHDRAGSEKRLSDWSSGYIHQFGTGRLHPQSKGWWRT